MANEDLGKYQGMMPSRAVLARLAIFGTSEETRASANAILKALPPMTADERRRYYDETWKLASLPSEKDMMLSPIGLATSELLKGNQPMTAQKPEVAAPVEADGSSPEPAKPAEAEPPAPAAETPNEYMSRLAWPPRSQQQPQPKTEEEPRDSLRPRYVAGRPSEPSKDLRPIADSDFDSNKLIY